MGSHSHFNPPVEVPQAEGAWEWFRGMGSPQFWVAPMVDQSELAFRMLCRRYGCTAAYTPMLHARLFLEGRAYRAEHFTTCDADRPLLAQFCANDPDTLLHAARLVEDQVDAVDLNLGCPQRIARRGRYGAFLMDDLPLVESLVRALAGGLTRARVTVKIRRFDEVGRTVAYAAALERAGASLVAVHARTREQKTAAAVRADWAHIAAVKAALRVPVLANGNVRSLADARACMRDTGADGGCRLLLEYLDLCDAYPAPFRMVKAHAFRMLGPWLAEHTDVRDELNRGPDLCNERVRELTMELVDRIEECGRDAPIPKISAKKLAAMEAEAARAAAIAEQAREAEGLAELGVVSAAAETVH
ncbi:TRNA-dihydrouridine(16/17) synthase [NAD(P)(+)]-like protein [Auxenochlorella protothecoides]|uniref:tRNA-dihydrouridine(16/17) synthase [NAD(P)(+)] n=1 Tax=Auxenochlorella protothecoides TaxID=3075 RepID=A0A087SJS4_AUXPR|nr:TRNA-dihydrouridine(16/17) synthase [NAD(P)(+)]-like protein [Auxenochlorella protothecoides]KFM25978.1 TRNA-dihydrouridine(16/17) synthase [NAD(P)(+)]-like protein [Auxenochlorella protothecoides]